MKRNAMQASVELIGRIERRAGQALVVSLLSLVRAAPAFAADQGTPLVNSPQQALGAASLFQMVGGLGLVVVIIFLLAWLVRRFGSVGLQGGSHFKVLSMLSLSTRERVVLLQVGEEQVLIGVAPGRVQTLHVLNKPVVADDNESRHANFADRLRQALKRDSAS